MATTGRLVGEVLADRARGAGAALQIRHHRRRDHRLRRERRVRLQRRRPGNPIGAEPPLLRCLQSSTHRRFRPSRQAADRTPGVAFQSGEVDSKIQFSEAFEGDAAAIFRAVEQMGFEAIVSKGADSRYRSGPSKSWLKAKCSIKSDFELLGVVREPGQAAQALMATPDRKYGGSGHHRAQVRDARPALGAGEDQPRTGAERLQQDRSGIGAVGSCRPCALRKRRRRSARCHAERGAGGGLIRLADHFTDMVPLRLKARR
jgi:hypothetical protein